MLAAHRAGLRRGAAGTQPQDLLEDVPQEIREEMRVEYANTIQRLLEIVLEPENKAAADGEAPEVKTPRRRARAPQPAA